MEEAEHFIEVLELMQKALKNEDSSELKSLSNQTIHSASCIQDGGSIALAVIIYTLGKLVERKDHVKIKNWESSMKKFNSWISLAIVALREKKIEEYASYLEKARASLSSISPSIKPYIQEILRKASINKASCIYEHGISLGKTAQLLGVTQWELSEYAGQKNVEGGFNTLDAKKRAKMALEFFS